MFLNKIIFMQYHTLAQILVVSLLIISNSRAFFLKKVKSDNLSIIPLISIIISILNILAFGINPLEILIFLLSFFVCLWNVRAFIRFTSGLVIDHFGPWFKFISSINLIFSLALLVFVIIFMPINDNKKKFNVNLTIQNYKGDFKNGFEKTDFPFDKKSLTIYEISKNPEKSKNSQNNKTQAENFLETENHEILAELNSEFESELKTETQSENPIQNAENPQENKIENENAEISLETQNQNAQKIILFIPPKCANFNTYKNFLYKLAYDNYKVYCAEFNSSDYVYFNKFFDLKFLKTDFFIYEKLFNKQKYENHIKAKSGLLRQEMRAFIKTLNLNDEQITFLVTEDDFTNSLPVIQNEFPQKINGIFDLNVDDSLYATGGWGPIENTNPVLAFFLKVKKENSGFISSHLANNLEKYAVQFNGL